MFLTVFTKCFHRNREYFIFFMIILISRYKISIWINVLIFLVTIFICLNVYFWFWLDFILVIEKLIQDGGRALRPEHPLRLNFKPNWGRISAITCKTTPKLVNDMVHSIKNFFREYLSLTSIRLTVRAAYFQISKCMVYYLRLAAIFGIPRCSILFHLPVFWNSW